MGQKIPLSFILGCPLIKELKFVGVSVHIHPNQHWWEMLDFTVFPTKAGGGDSIHTHCNTFYLIVNALIMINLEYLPVKNILR